MSKQFKYLNCNNAGFYLKCLYENCYFIINVFEKIDPHLILWWVNQKNWYANSLRCFISYIIVINVSFHLRFVQFICSSTLYISYLLYSNTVGIYCSFYLEIPSLRNNPLSSNHIVITYLTFPHTHIVSLIYSFANNHLKLLFTRIK